MWENSCNLTMTAAEVHLKIHFARKEKAARSRIARFPNANTNTLGKKMIDRLSRHRRTVSPDAAPSLLDQSVPTTELGVLQTS